MKRTVVMALVAALLGAGPAAARDRERGREAAPAPEDRFGAPRGDGPSADDAARRAQQQYGGRVLAVRPEGPGFRVKLLKDGEVRSVYMGP